MSLLLPTIETLNKYSGLLQVIIGTITAAVTIVYVVLTWRNLKAFERSTRNEREARHLDDIKLNVVVPILRWIEEVHATLSGQGSRNIVSVQLIDKPEQSDRPFYLCEATIRTEFLSKVLHADAAKTHFRLQLEKYASVSRALEEFFADVAMFACDCSNRLDNTSKLPRPKYNDRVGFDFYDIEGFVQGCLRAIPNGFLPPWYPQNIVSNRTTAFINGSQSAVAQDEIDRLDVWFRRDIEVVQNQWRDSGLGNRMGNLRKDVEALRSTMQEVELFQTLPGRCKYLGE